MKITPFEYRKPKNLDLLDLSEVDSIALHHMAHMTANIFDVTGWHIDDNKWSWIGYSYFITTNGEIFEARGLKYLPAGVKDHNSHIISIGFQGDYNLKFMNYEQMKAGIDLIRYLKEKLPNIKVVAGHNHWNDTSCPGKNFPMDRILKDVNTMNKSIDPNFKKCVDLVTKEIGLNSPDFWYKIQTNPDEFMRGLKPEYIQRLFELTANRFYTLTGV